MRHPFLLSKAELSFYGVLKQALGDSGGVFTKVRVADVITPQKGLERGIWQGAFNSISAKHFDFLVCDQATSKVLMAIELDDASHNTNRARKRDEFLGRACDSAELPLLRVTASNTYAIATLREQLAECGAIALQVTSPPKMQTAGNEKPPAQQETAVPKCAKCGADTVVRKARSGPNAGQQFWGCSTYPKCRGVTARRP